LIEAETGIAPEIIEGSRGEYTVWVGDTKVAQKTADGFPTEQDTLTAVQRELAKGAAG
jgi:hypothetical protein